MAVSATYMKTFILISCIVFVVCSMQAEAIGCDSCGRECASACGTRHFRTCCFNYLRKRSSPPPLPQQDLPPELKLELLQAKSQLARNYLNTLRGNGDWHHIEVIEPLSETHWKGEKDSLDIRNNEKTSSGHNSNEQTSDMSGGRLQLIYDS